jgi:hypothetical protein
MRRLAILTLGVLCVVPEQAAAQETAERLRVYLDCHTHECDFDHFRREIAFADWVRDREDAQVHVLITAEETGGGGDVFTLAFIGLADFTARDDSLTYTSQDTDTDAEVRAGLTRTLSLGLVSYAARLAGAERLGVTYDASDIARVPQVAVDDPWDSWVFRVRAGGELEGESLQRSYNAEGGASATRITEALKLEFDLEGNYNRDEYTDEYEDPNDSTVILDSIIVSTRHSWETNGLAALSLGRHWSAGALLEVGASTRANQDLFVQGGPALEYNVFPYSESTRRSLALMLVVGGIYYNYTEQTYLRRWSEGHPAHSLEANFDQRQPWGSVHARFEWLQFWHDLDVHRFELFGALEIRLFRGLSLDLFGSFARVKDQIYLVADEESTEELLLQERIRGTAYEYSIDFGLSYRFGSAFNTVVNPRMR